MDSFQPIRSIPHLVPSPFSVRLQRDSPIHSLPISRSYPIQPGPSPIVPHCRPFPTVKTLSTKDLRLFNPLRAWAILSSLSDSEQAFNRRNPYLIRTPFRYPLCHPCEKYMAVKHFLGYRKDLPSPRSPPSLLPLMPSLLVTQRYHNGEYPRSAPISRKLLWNNWRHYTRSIRPISNHHYFEILWRCIHPLRWWYPFKLLHLDVIRLLVWPFWHNINLVFVIYKPFQ